MLLYCISLYHKHFVSMCDYSYYKRGNFKLSKKLAYITYIHALEYNGNQSPKKCTREPNNYIVFCCILVVLLKHFTPVTTKKYYLDISQVIFSDIDLLQWEYKTICHVMSGHDIIQLSHIMCSQILDLGIQ